MPQPGRNFKQPQRPFKAESELGADPNEQDIVAGQGTIAWKQPETHEQYGSLYEQMQAGEGDLYDLNNLTDAMGYNRPHGPSRSGQRGGAD